MPGTVHVLLLHSFLSSTLRRLGMSGSASGIGFLTFTMASSVYRLKKSGENVPRDAGFPEGFLLKLFSAADV